MLLATFFGFGRLRPGPGTWASATTVILWSVVASLLPLSFRFPIAISLVILIVAIGIPAATGAARTSGIKDPQFVVIDSWNDFSHGTEVCATRQYGERYADDTRLFSNTFNGSREWHAKYLSAVVPTTIRPKTLYTIPVRIENAGTLPWRSREQYALCPRWYKDGRLFDDSAPRVPIGDDVLPGQSRTLNVGLVAINAYGSRSSP